MRYLIIENAVRDRLMAIPKTWTTSKQHPLQKNTLKRWAELKFIEVEQIPRVGQHGPTNRYRRIVDHVATQEDAGPDYAERMREAKRARQKAYYERLNGKTPTIPGARFVAGRAQSGSPDAAHDGAL